MQATLLIEQLASALSSFGGASSVRCVTISRYDGAVSSVQIQVEGDVDLGPYAEALNTDIVAHSHVRKDGTDVEWLAVHATISGLEVNVMGPHRDVAKTEAA